MATTVPLQSKNKAVSAPPATPATTPPTQARVNPRKGVTCGVLPRESYHEWDSLVERSPHGTVFHYSWWLELAATEFSILGVRNDHGALVAGMPVPFGRRSGLKLVHSPPLTPYLGPIFDLSTIRNTCDRLHLMRSYGETLARNIEGFDSFRCLAGACAPDLQGFLWAGFDVQLAYTFRFPANYSLDRITAGMTRTHMQKLTKALRLGLTVTRDEGVEELLLLHQQTFERQDLKSSTPPELVRKLWEAAHARGKAHLYVARTSDSTPAAALLTFNDPRTTYQIVSGVHSKLRDVPGAYLVLWNALQDAILAGRDFDFEGSHLRGVECFYRRWGASAVPVWRIEKAGSSRGALFQFLIHRRDAAALKQPAS